MPEATVAAALAQARGDWVALDAARLTAIPDEAAVVLANEAAAQRITGPARRRRCGSWLTDGGSRASRSARDGAVAACDGEIHRAAPPSPEANVDDAAGAGDAFAAALLVELARGAGVPDALAAACDAGAAVARAGAGAGVLEAR